MQLTGTPGHELLGKIKSDEVRSTRQNGSFCWRSSYSDRRLLYYWTVSQHSSVSAVWLVVCLSVCVCVSLSLCLFVCLSRLEGSFILCQRWQRKTSVTSSKVQILSVSPNIATCLIHSLVKSTTLGFPSPDCCAQAWVLKWLNPGLGFSLRTDRMLQYSQLHAVHGVSPTWVVNNNK